MNLNSSMSYPLLPSVTPQLSRLAPSNVDSEYYQYFRADDRLPGLATFSCISFLREKPLDSIFPTPQVPAKPRVIDSSLLF